MNLRPAPSSALRPAWTAAAITLAFTLLLCVLVLARIEQGALGFAAIGTAFSEGDPDGTVGYDGQFAYFIARDGAEATPYIDGPTLRYTRIIYPLVSRALAFGNTTLLPWVLLGVNIAALTFGAGCTAYLARRFGARRGLSALSGVVYGLWIGGQFTVRFDLNETLCMAFALAAVAAYLDARMRVTILLLILAALTKEIGLVFAAALALHALVNHRRGWALLLLGAPVLAFGLWWLILRLWFGTLPTIYPAAQTIRLIPLAGLFIVESPVEFVFLTLWIALPAVLLSAWVFRTIWRRRALSLGASLALAGAFWAMLMPDVTWQDQIAAYRVAMPLIAGALLFAAETRPQNARWLAALWLPALLLIVITPIWLGGG